MIERHNILFLQVNDPSKTELHMLSCGTKPRQTITPFHGIHRNMVTGRFEVMATEK